MFYQKEGGILFIHICLFVDSSKLIVISQHLLYAIMLPLSSVRLKLHLLWVGHSGHGFKSVRPTETTPFVQLDVSYCLFAAASYTAFETQILSQTIQ